MQYYFKFLCHVWLGKGSHFREPSLGLLHYDGLLLYRQRIQWICTNYPTGESHYTFRDWENDWVGQQTQKTHSELDLVMTLFINFPLYASALTG